MTPVSVTVNYGNGSSLSIPWEALPENVRAALQARERRGYGSTKPDVEFVVAPSPYSEVLRVG